MCWLIEYIKLLVITQKINHYFSDSQFSKFIFQRKDLTREWSLNRMCCEIPVLSKNKLNLNPDNSIILYDLYLSHCGCNSKNIMYNSMNYCSWNHSVYVLAKSWGTLQNLHLTSLIRNGTVEIKQKNKNYYE